MTPPVTMPQGAPPPRKHLALLRDKSLLPAMQFEYFAPSAPLAGLVAFHYGLETADIGADAGRCALLGQVQVIVGGAVKYRFGHHYSRAIAAPT
ncbi:MAG: hypothetical protein H7267_09180 [Sandarakinorhabdus sp.]|nr:hypothetical protein [Sandarakinorhabdus sp.]